MNKRQLVNLAFVLAIILAGIGWQWNRQRNALAKAERQAQTTEALEQQMRHLLSNLRDAEIGQRGFIITGDEQYLEPYHQGLSQIHQNLALLRSNAENHPNLLKLIEGIESLTEAKLAELKETIELRRVKGFDPAAQVVRRNLGKSLMDQIRKNISALQAEEEGLLKAANQARNAALSSTGKLGVVGSALGYIFLIMTLVLLQDAMRICEKRLRHIFEQTKEGVFLLSPCTGKIIDANPSISSLLGYRREELQGKELWRIGLAKDAEALRAAVLQMGEKEAGPYQTITLQTARGELREVEVAGSSYQEHGTSVIQLNIRDITERKRMEQALKTALEREREAHAEAERARTRFRSLFESAPGLYLVLTPEEFKIVAASDKFLMATMTQRSEIMGRSFFEVFPDDPNEPWADGVRNLRASLDRVCQTRKADIMSVQRYPMRRSPEGGGEFEERYWSPVNSPVFGPENELEYIIHRVEDVTGLVHSKQREGVWKESSQRIQSAEDRMEAEILLRAMELQQINQRLRSSEEQLEAANRELTDFAVIVSHDLKAPLRAVATLAKWMQTDYGDKLDEEGRENLQEMVKRVQRMDSMIDGILHYSRIGREQEKNVPVALGDLVSEVVQDIASPEGVQVHGAEGLPAVPGDPMRLRQVFQNLIGNAVKYSQPPVEIWVNVTDRGTVWEFSVKDNGPGIEQRHFERIFKIFQTLAPMDRTDSTGVGLALVKRIVEKSGGRVWVESRVGEGSTFYFTWPKMSMGAEGKPARDLEATAWGGNF